VYRKKWDEHAVGHLIAHLQDWEGLMTSGLDTEHSLVDLFNDYFKVVPADSPEDREKCYRLRYRVYYEEGLFPGMNPDECPEQIEKDEYDNKRSKHCLLIYKHRGIIAGTVRLIMPDTENLDARCSLESLSGDLFFRDIISDENIPRSCVGEISRFILAPEFRARKGENQHSYGSENHLENFLDTSHNHFNQSKKIQRRKFPHAILGLFVGVVRLSFENKVAYWYANMDPACARF